MTWNVTSAFLLGLCAIPLISLGLAWAIIWLLRYYKQPTLDSINEVASTEELAFIGAEQGHGL